MGPKGRLVYNGHNVKVHFEMDRQGIAKCAMGPELFAGVMDIAQNTALPYAVGISPRSKRRHQHYADSFVVVPGTAWIAAMRRVAARLYNLSEHATIVEVGTEKTPKHRVLGRTVDHLNSLGHEHN